MLRLVGTLLGSTSLAGYFGVRTVPVLLAGFLLSTLTVAFAQIEVPCRCGQPVTSGESPVATDCLYILNAAVGLQVCVEPCVCDTNGSGGAADATDALVCLNAAVGVLDVLACDCDQSCGARAQCTHAKVFARPTSKLDLGWTSGGHRTQLSESASIHVKILRRCGGAGDACDLDEDCGADTCDLTCDCDGSGDTQCEVAGPVGAKRCLGAIHQTCQNNDDCGGSSACRSVFGPPQPLVALDVPICVISHFEDDLSGTVDFASGASQLAATLRSRVQFGINDAMPCPRCGGPAENPVVGDTFVCEGGPGDGMACIVEGTTEEFGGTSNDCPPVLTPAVSLSGLRLRLSASTGERALDAQLPCGGGLAALHPSSGNAFCLDNQVPCSTNADCLRCRTSPTTPCVANDDCGPSDACVAAPEQPVSCGVYCHCGFCNGVPESPCSGDADCTAGEICEQGNAPTQQIQNNDCSDLICGLNEAERCCSEAAADCIVPTEQVGSCSHASFRSCDDNEDCASQNAGACVFVDRACFENRISRTGTESPLDAYCVDEPATGACDSNADCGAGSCVDDSATPTLVALICVPPTQSASVNDAFGVPGPAAVALELTMLWYRCGDGLRDEMEECDDGNLANGDGCDERCRNEP